MLFFLIKIPHLTDEPGINGKLPVIGPDRKRLDKPGKRLTGVRPL